MVAEKPPQKPTNLRPYECDLVINGQHFTKLEISPYYEKHNEEYLEALERKEIKLSEKELAEKLINDDLIREILLLQLDGKEVKKEGEYYHWTYYTHRAFKETEYKIKAYKLVLCFDSQEIHILGVMDCYRQRKYDKIK